MNPSFSPDLVKDLGELFTFQFMRSALEAGTIVAILAAVAGWYMVMRRQSFAGHTLALMSFPGATGAALLGLPTSLGYYLAATGAAVTMGRSGRQTRTHSGETATIATVQAVGLAAGFVFLSLNHTVLGG
ncbi:MAG: metal ABC transporter permease, partial [Solirubrobacterales bacterium]|nr:metal ABC transporter permease [Solirubrobacterales bacterium]